jgi:alpha-L-rhamnosidase
VAGVTIGVAVSSASAASAPESPAQLQVDLMTAPMAVPTSGIWLSWQPRDTRVGESQGGYEVRVATTAAAATSGTATWDSGRKSSSTPSSSYAGPGLKAYNRYWWTVRTWDAQGHAGPWAAPAQFQTALGSTWATRPIWSAPVSGKTSGWAFLRGTLTVASKPVIAATVYATALSSAAAHQYVFRLSVNGHVLGDGPAQSPAPGSATYYQAWDVTSYLKEGSKDTFGALAYTAQNQDFDLEVIIEYQGGVRQAWGTGSSGWQAVDGGSVYPSAGSIGTTYYAAPVEDLNAEKYPFGFDTPSFNARGWTAPVVKSAIAGLTPVPTPNPALVEHHPVKVTQLAGTGNYLLDFGTTQVGGMLLGLTGTNGRRVTLEYGEVLASPTSVKYNLSTGNVYKDVFTLKSGSQVLQYWGYRVFRYVEVLNTPQAMTTSNSQDLALVYPDQPSSSSLTTSSAALDEVWQFSKNTIEDLGTIPYVDSPTRERSGADEGDGYIHQLAQAAVDGDSADARYSLLFALTAMAGNNPDESITEYEQLAPVAALDSWWQTGDPATLASLYPNLQKMLLPVGSNGLVSMPATQLGSNATQSVGPGALVGQPSLDIPQPGEAPSSVKEPGYPTTLVDWPPDERGNFVFTTANTVVEAFAYAAYNAMAQIATELRQATQATQYASDASAIKTAIQTLLYDPSTGAFYDGLPSLTTHESMLTSVYVLAVGAASAAQEKAAAAFVAQHGITAPTTVNGTITDGACSVYCAAYFLRALYDGGQAQAALNTLTSDSETSWLHMISLGAGSTMEAWEPSIKPNLSYSHPWAASPAFIVPNDLFGIAPLTPGWGSILIAPQPGDLASGTMLMPTARGEIRESFSQPSGGPFTITVGIPTAATAEIALPGVTPGQQVLVDGTLTTTTALTPDSPLAATGGATLAVVPAGSGDHTITATTALAAGHPTRLS